MLLSLAADSSGKEPELFKWKIVMILQRMRIRLGLEWASAICHWCTASQRDTSALISNLAEAYGLVLMRISTTNY
jgi:hypothetical protein